MTRKRKFILFIAIVVILLLFLTSIYLLFRVRNVKVNYKYSSQDINVPTDDQIKLKVDKIIEESGFKKNSFILFSSKEKALNNIESKNDDIKVINIEKKFPGTVVIEVYKKTGLYSLKLNNSKYAILDEDLQLVKIQENNPNEIYIKITGLSVNEEEVDKIFQEEQIENKNVLKAIKLLENNFELLSNSKNRNVIENREKYFNFVKELNINTEKKEMILITRNDFKIKYDLKIKNIEKIINTSIEYCKDPKLQNFLINISNNKKEEIRKQNFYIIFTLKEIDGNFEPEPKIVEEENVKY